MKTNYLILLCICVLPFTNQAQVVVPEQVKSSCAGLEMSKRVRLAVARFSQTSQNSYGNNIENFSTMLSNAMFEIECFRMLSTIQDNNYRYTGKENKDILPHFIITGEITEYNHQKQEIKLPFMTKTIIKAHIGYILQIKDPVTREIIFSKSFNQDGSSENDALQVTMRGYQTTPSGSSDVDKAYHDAMEKGIIEAVTYIVDSREKIYARAHMILASETSGSSTLIIIVQSATFSGLTEIQNALLAKKGVVQGVEKNLSNGKGTISVQMNGDNNALVDILQQAFGSRLEITAYEKESMTIKLK